MGRSPNYDAVRDAAHSLGPGWFFSEDVLRRLESRSYDTSIDQVAAMLDHLYRREGQLERRNEAAGRLRAMWRVPNTA